MNQGELDSAVPDAKFVPARIMIHLKNGQAGEQVTAIPASFVDDLAFTGRGFTVTFRLLQCLEKLEETKSYKGKKKAILADYAGAILQVSIGEVAGEMGGDPPFDPPYSSQGVE